MRLLDLFCGAGGAAMGYHRAGFEVVGVDNVPQRHFPFEFHLADAMTFPLDGFDAIHASPPCKGFTVAYVRGQYGPGAGRKRTYPDLLTPTRDRLLAAGVPFVIENVPGAPMRADVVLCGTMFGLKVRRHRLFETNWEIRSTPPPCDHSYQVFSVFGHGAGNNKWGKRPDAGTAAEWREAMGIDWMPRDVLSQAIPPAYTEWLGHQLAQYARGWEVILRP